MGRKKILLTEKDKKRARKEAQHRYYLKNKERLDEKAKGYYQKKVRKYV